MSDIILTAHCHCSFASFTCTIPPNALPLKATICHCNSCRYTTGQLFATMVVIPAKIPLPDFSHLQSYASSKELTRYSCPKCGAYVADADADEWQFGSGMLSNLAEVSLDRVQIFIEDTRDGGASIWFQPGHGTNPLRRLRGRDSAEATDAVIEAMRQKSRQCISSSPVTSESSLRASCHCGAVEFCIRALSSSSPDKDIGSEEDTKRPPPSPPYPALLCACTSCRLTTGFELSAWITAPRSHIYFTSTTTPPPSASSTTTHPTPTSYPLTSNPALLAYASSPSVQRYSCKTCGATAFYVRDNNDDSGGSVDIAAGLLRAESGCRAEEWVRWGRGVDFIEEMVDKRLGGALGRGLRGLDGEEEE